MSGGTREDGNNLFKKINRQNINKSYIIVYGGVLLAVIVLVFIQTLSGKMSPEDLFWSVAENLTGVLAGFFVFDIFQERLAKDSYAEEMSHNIMGTIMGKPEMIEPFNPEQRQEFLRATITSFTRNEMISELLMTNIDSYLEGGKSWKIRTEYTYDFELFPRVSRSWNFLSDTEEYFYVQEKLNYKMWHLSGQADIHSGRFRLGFLFDAQGLDNALREKKNDEEDYSDCIFRESLSLLPEDVEKLKQLQVNGKKEELLKIFDDMFRLDVQIDREQTRLVNVMVNDKGIFATMECNHAIESTYVVRIIFYMPKKWDTLLEIALVDPTKAPKVFVSYQEEVMDVEMIAFLSKGDESRDEVAHAKRNGVYDISLNNEWIFPISGMVFTVRKREEPDRERQGI